MAFTCSWAITYRIEQQVKEVNAVSIQAVLQGAGLVSGLIRIEIHPSGRSAACRLTLRSPELNSFHCTSDQFLFNLSSFYSEKKKILLTSVIHLSKNGRYDGSWSLLEDVETSFGQFYYSLLCSEYGPPLKPGDTLVFELQTSDEQFTISDSCFLDAPTSTLDGFQAAVAIRFSDQRRTLAGGQFELV